MTILSNYLRQESVSCDLRAKNKDEVLVELGNLLAVSSRAPDAKTITEALVDRERLATTGVGEGVAIPHAKLDGIRENKIAIGVSLSPEGVSFDAVDGKPVYVFFALLAPLDSAGDHLRILAQISRLLKDGDVRSRLRKVESPAELIEIIRSEEGKDR